MNKSNTRIKPVADLVTPQAGRRLVKVEITDPRIDTITEVVYSQHFHNGTHSLHMTLFVPNTSEPKPCVIYFPGGGFTTSDYGKWGRLRMRLALEGFVVAAVEYRTIPHPFPAILIDGKTAVRYLRAHAKQFGIDKERIGVMGNSAGGYLAQLVTMTADEKEFDEGDFLEESSATQACCDIFGPSDLASVDEGFPPEIQAFHRSPSAAEALLLNGVTYGRSPSYDIHDDLERASWASPMGHLKPGLPPFLIMHGTHDMMVSRFQSVHLYEALMKLNTPVEFIEIADAGHGDDYWFQRPVIDLITSWFKSTLMPECSTI